MWPTSPNLEILASVALALACSTAGAVLFKLGAAGRHLHPEHGTAIPMHVFARDMFGSPQILLGLVLQAVALFAWIAFISRVALSLAFPLSSASNVAILLASRFILHENISPRRWFGVGLILGGIALIGAGAA